MAWQFNVYAIPFILTMLPLAYCAYLAWRGRSRLPERLFLALTVTLLWLIALYSVRLLTRDRYLLEWLAKLQFPANHVAPTLWLLFNLAYFGYDWFISRRLVGLLMVFPLLYAALVWTNDYHQLHWAQVGVTNYGSLVILDYIYSYSLFFWLSVTYVYLMLLAATTIILIKLTRPPYLFQQQSGALLLASLLPWAATVVDLTHRNPWPMIEINFLALTMSVGLLALSLFRFRLLDMAPTAHDMIVRSMTDAVFVLDLQHRIVEANPAAAELMQRTLHEVIGRTALDLFGALSEKLTDYFQAYDISEELSCHTSGEPRLLDVRISPLRNPWGAVHGRIVLVRDITEHRRAEQQAVQLAFEQEKVHLLNEFIDITSHDLNTPLTTLRISTDLLRIYTDRLPTQVAKLRMHAGMNTGAGMSSEGFADLEKLVQSVLVNSQRVNDSASRLERLVGEMLEMIRLDKRLHLDAVDACLNDVGAAIIAQARPAAAEKRLTLTFTPDPQLPALPFDTRQLSVALRHLVRNAITYTPDGGQVSVRTFWCAGRVLAEVSDTGIGIPADDLPYIFDRFYRVDKARNSQTGGMGLGLAIVKKIVDAHQGQVEVESTLGQGSTFRLFLPGALAQS